MMQCADPNTLPAPSRLHQLGQSLSLSLLPLSYILTVASRSFTPTICLTGRQSVCFLYWRDCPPLLNTIRSHSHLFRVFGLCSRSSALPSASSCLRKCQLSDRCATELAGSRKIKKMLGSRSAKDIKADETACQSLTGEKNCAENVSQTK